MARLLISMILLCSAAVSFAQDKQSDEEQGGDKSFGTIYGLHTGPLLPNQIQGMTEIMPTWGARYAFPLRKGHLELGLANSQSSGTSYYNVSASYRGDVQLEDMFAVLYAGLDTHYWHPPGEAFLTNFGAHVGGGFAAHLSDQLWFRSDMKFNLNPGTALYIGFGLEWREKGGGGGGEGAN
jgi:hypothetical protein